ncbi:MAG: thiol reductase thioredoxin [Bacteroidales bacterium]|nr:thiol reductase thioredoxin [Bacteroidales bacterium]
MKKVFFVLSIAILGTMACNSSDGNNTTPPAKAELKDAIDKPVYLTKQMFIDEIMDYQTNTTQWVYKGDMPGLVDFYADWCRPCKITSPILDELAQEYAGQIKIYKVNVDVERELAAVFGVQSIPTFLFMPMNGNPTMSAGIAQTPEQTKELFRQQIEEILLKKQ